MIIEGGGFNNSLAGSSNCPNAYSKLDWKEPAMDWANIYLKDGTILYYLRHDPPLT